MRETRRAKIKTTWTGHDATVAVVCTTQGEKGHLAECEWCRCCDVVIQIGRWRFTAPVDRIIEAVGVAHHRRDLSGDQANTCKRQFPIARMSASARRARGIYAFWWHRRRPRR